MIIDTHIHIYDPSRPEGVSWPPPENKLLYRTVLPEHAKAEAVPEGVTDARRRFRPAVEKVEGERVAYYGSGGDHRQHADTCALPAPQLADRTGQA